jgi:hypothetical protein
MIESVKNVDNEVLGSKPFKIGQKKGYSGGI